MHGYHLAGMADLGVQLEVDDHHSKGTSAGWYHLWSHAFSSASADAQTSVRNTSAVAWEGIFPLRRGGVVVFALCTTQPFIIAVTPSSTAEAPGDIPWQKMVRVLESAQITIAL